jgi:subtilisin family serine protease
MISVTYGGKQGTPFELLDAEDYLVVRTATRAALRRAPLAPPSREILGGFDPALRFPEAGVDVLRVARGRPGRETRDLAREILKRDPALEFAGRVLTDRSGQPVVYTENLFVKFHDPVKADRRAALLAAYGLAPRARLAVAANAWFVAARSGTGQAVFDLARRLLAEEEVELCHPELVRQVRRRKAFPEQWHLGKTRVNGRVVDQHANVVAAWRRARGGRIVIALIDDGVDVDHEELAVRGKIVSPWDATYRRPDPRPGSEDDHGTACAGVACAAGRRHASGVAPSAKLMPIRLVSGLGSRAEAEAFVWAADHGADVISCSWGPVDGDWSDPGDPRHRQRVPLPDSTRLAIDHAVSRGRKGKGCVVVFAAGNGNESVDNDGYASCPKVMAVAACNDSGTRSVYSDFGRAVWCAFPSSDLSDSALTPGIWTTDRSGNPGYNAGRLADGDRAGNYTNSFGGTSSAAPGVAGVVALVLSENPALTAAEVREIIRRSCDRIDPAGGAYDAAGHSPKYGHGRVNAARAVALAAAAIRRVPRRRRKRG